MKTPLILPLCVAPFFLIPGACAQAPDAPITQAIKPLQASQNHTFFYRADRKLNSVSVAGTFNNWNKDALPLRVEADGLTWRATLPLNVGSYAYKFVLDGKDWVNDPTTLSEANADGDINSVLTLTAAGNTSAVSMQVAPGNADKVVVLTPDKAREASATAHTFIYHADKKLESVAVAGEFNGWNKEANALKVDADGLTWRTTLPLVADGAQYKFVLNGDTWVVDPGNPNRFTESSGNVNSLVVPADYQKEAAPDDGQIASSALRHEPKLPYLNYDRGQLRFLLRARPNDVSRVWLQIGERQVPMTVVRSSGIYAWYGATIAWDRKTDLSYSFGLWEGESVRKFGADGLKSSRPFQLSAKTFQPFVVPDWVEKTVFYQIFPDRFDNGDKTNDPTKIAAWNSTPTSSSRFGGDVAGIKQHLDHLSELGISGVYFNPVFKSPSNHRYDAEDYKQVDPQFGTNAEFADLTKELQRRGIRTLMDFVFNHTATNFAPFIDVRKNGPASKYKDWYLIKSFPVRVQEPPNYIAWGGFSAMPKLNLMNPETGNTMLDVVNFWKKEVPLSGLRLDVADEVDIRFWRKLRERVKGLDPQMWIVGERWSDASPWLEGDQWDAAMNYPFRDANAAFFAEGKTSPTQFVDSLMERYNAYPPQVSRNMLNLLSSHDTARFLTVAHGDRRLQQLAATVQFTWVGAPSIYYGEELGMEGGPDPDNRRPMSWDKATPDNSMLNFYKRLVAVRNGSRALQSGTPATLMTDNTTKTLAYSRTLGDDMAIVALNRSDKEQTLKIPLPRSAQTIRFMDAWTNQAFTGKQGSLSIKLAPFSSAILLQPQK